jgi:hypothetical protein
MYKRKQKPFMMTDKIGNIAKDDAHTGTRVDLVSELGLTLTTLNTTGKN